MKPPKFGPWISWDRRFDVTHCERPGVYLLGQFKSRPPLKVNPISKQVLYFGETCNQTLANRWYQFNRSAFERKRGHSGGLTFSKLVVDGVAISPEWLYVAALPVLLDEPHRSAYIRLVERQLIWAYVEKFNALPLCNRK